MGAEFGLLVLDLLTLGKHEVRQMIEAKSEAG